MLDHFLVKSPFSFYEGKYSLEKDRSWTMGNICIICCSCVRRGRMWLNHNGGSRKGWHEVVSVRHGWKLRKKPNLSELYSLDSQEASSDSKENVLDFPLSQIQTMLNQFVKHWWERNNNVISATQSFQLHLTPVGFSFHISWKTAFLGHWLHSHLQLGPVTVPAGPGHPEVPRSYLQEQASQVLVLIQQPQSRSLQLRFAPKGAFPLPGSPCWGGWVYWPGCSQGTPKSPPAPGVWGEHTGDMRADVVSRGFEKAERGVAGRCCVQWF